MKEFMLVFNGNHKNWNEKTPEDWNALMDKHTKWSKKLVGKWSGTKLAPKPSKFLSEKNGNFVIKDGPYTETKEVLTGFYLIKAENLDHATELAKGCPWLLHDTVEIFQTEVEED